MSDDLIIQALRARPADEPPFERPLRLPDRDEEASEPLTGLIPSLGLRRAGGRRPAVRSRTPIGPVMALVLLAVAVVITAVLLRPEAAPAAATPPSPQPLLTFQPTGLVGCWDLTWPRGEVAQGQCEPLAVLPAGYERVAWSLDPAYPLSAESREIHVLVRNSCSSEELSGPVAQHVEYDATRVMVSLASLPAPRNLPSGVVAVCPDVLRNVQPVHYAVALSEALGRRTLYDAEPDPMKLVAAAAASEGTSSAPAEPTPLRSGGVDVPAQSATAPTVPTVPTDPTAQAAPTPLLYTVTKRDTSLTEIAAKFNTTVAAIVAYNQLLSLEFQIRNPNVIWPGMQFYIPPPGWTPGPATPSATAERSK